MKRRNDLVGLFKYVSFVGAAFLLVAIAPWSDAWAFYSQLVGSFVLMWGGCYFMLKENETLYGSVCVIFAVLIQPIYAIPFSSGLWMIISFLGSGYLCLSGLLCVKIEKARAAAKAKIEAELEMYRKNEEKLKAQQEAARMQQRQQHK